jgi:hypothetical protein
MSSNDHANDRKRKPMKIPETVSSNDSRNSNEESNKVRRVSTNASASNTASLQVDTPVATAKAITTANAASTEHEESIQSIGKLIQDLFHSDNAKVNTTLDALDLDFIKDKKNCESLVTAGGCFVLTHLMKNCLDKAMDEIPACNQVTKLTDFTELMTLHKTLNVITSLTFWHAESRIGIAAIGGVETVVKVMKTFPKCQTLQECACGALLNLTFNNVTGKKKANESGGIEAFLAAVHNHLCSARLCEVACWALSNIIEESKETTGLLISLGGGAAVAKVRTKWADNKHVQTRMRKLADLIGAEMKAWADEE